MIKNNIAAFWGHVFLAGTVLLLFMKLIPDGLVLFDDRKNLFFNLIYGVLVVLGYVALGFILNKQPSLLKNLISVSGIAVVGIIILLLEFTVFESKAFPLDWTGIFCAAYNAPLLMIHPHLFDAEPRFLCLLVFSLFPTLFTWIGLMIK